MNSKPELEGVLKPILLEFEDALMEIDKIDTNNFLGFLSNFRISMGISFR